MPKKISEIAGLLYGQTKATQIRQYVSNSDYDVLWTGTLAGKLQQYNDYIETVNIPGQAISTNESRTANSFVAKTAGDMTFEDLEISWRVTSEFGVYYALMSWMKSAKILVDPISKYTICGYYDEYCTSQRCDIITNIPTPGAVVVIDGLYPTNVQSMPFSTEGGEYVKLTATFSCNYIYQQTEEEV